MALQRALEMEQGERADRTRRNLEYSQRLTTANWATQVSGVYCVFRVHAFFNNECTQCVLSLPFFYKRQFVD